MQPLALEAHQILTTGSQLLRKAQQTSATLRSKGAIVHVALHLLEPLREVAETLVQLATKRFDHPRACGCGRLPSHGDTRPQASSPTTRSSRSPFRPHSKRKPPQEHWPHSSASGCVQVVRNRLLYHGPTSSAGLPTCVAFSYPGGFVSCPGGFFYFTM